MTKTNLIMLVILIGVATILLGWDVLVRSRALGNVRATLEPSDAVWVDASARANSGLKLGSSIAFGPNYLVECVDDTLYIKDAEKWEWEYNIDKNEYEVRYLGANKLK